MAQPIEGEPAQPVCGAAILAAHLALEKRRAQLIKGVTGIAVQAGGHDHNFAEPIRWANQLDGFVVRPSWLHISALEKRRAQFDQGSDGSWSCAGWGPRPQFCGANTLGEPAGRICGAAILAAHLGAGIGKSKTSVFLSSSVRLQKIATYRCLLIAENLDLVTWLKNGAGVGVLRGGGELILRMCRFYGVYF